jgi:hypothetical protein
MILAAVRYLLENTPISDRGDVMAEIIEIICQATQDLPVDQSDSFGDETPSVAPP